MSTPVTRATVHAPVRRHVLSRRRAVAGYLYISPFLLGFLIFTAVPVLASLYLSLTSYQILDAPRFIGIENYRQALFKDKIFREALFNSTYFAVIGVPLGLAGSLLCAVLLNQPIKGRAIFRTLYFLPSITPVVATTLLWMWILNPDFGLMNYSLSLVNIPGPKWLGSTEWSKPALILMHLWGSMGGGAMIIFLAGLQGIPEELYESAAIDGAKGFQRFWHITIPMLSPTIFLNLVLGLIGALKVFTTAFVATDGGPGYSTLFYILYLFNNAFKFLEMGFASALAWIFTVLVLALTYAQVRLSRRWVYYAGESRE